MKTALSHYRHGAALRVHKLLNTLGLASPSSPNWGHLQFVLVVALFMTDLTSMNGLITISPEGGP